MLNLFKTSNYCNPKESKIGNTLEDSTFPSACFSANNEIVPNLLEYQFLSFSSFLYFSEIIFASWVSYQKLSSGKLEPVSVRNPKEMFF